jgi:hypothetical protein
MQKCSLTKATSNSGPLLHSRPQQWSCLVNLTTIWSQLQRHHLINSQQLIFFQIAQMLLIKKD